MSRPWEREDREIPLPFFPFSDRFQYVSLEYNRDEGDFAGYPVACPQDASSDDMDDVAALIASLDLVVGVPTTAIHLAGALGVPAICLLNEFPSWRFGIDGDTMVWHDSVKLIRRGKVGLHEALEQLSEAIDAHFGRAIKYVAHNA